MITKYKLMLLKLAFPHRVEIYRYEALVSRSEDIVYDRRSTIRVEDRAIISSLMGRIRVKLNQEVTQSYNTVKKVA